MKSRRHEGIAAALSTILPGLGQIYSGEIVTGILFIVAVFLSIVIGIPCLVGFVLLPFLWIYSIYDAQRTAIEINAELEKEKLQ